MISVAVRNVDRHLCIPFRASLITLALHDARQTAVNGHDSLVQRWNSLQYRYRALAQWV